jgi:predicted acylesterase/phospholipase RssA
MIKYLIIMIKYLVINGGGPTGLMSYGSLKYLFQHEFVKLENIHAIYGTSIGAILGVIISLNYDWKTLDDYLLKRPWNKVFTLEPHDFFEMYSTKGLFQFNLVEELLKPLLTAKDLNETITLKEFYEYTKIDLHFYTVEMNSFEKVDLHHLTYPELSLIKALEMSSAVPVLFKPVFYENKCYVDGGFFDNYPVNECLENENCDINEILGIRNKWSNKETIINGDMNLFQYLQSSFHQIVKHIQKENVSKTLIYEIKCLCDTDLSDYTNWLDYMTHREKIAELIEKGQQYGELFLNYEKEMICRTNTRKNSNVEENKPSADQEDQEDKPSADQEDQEDKPSADQEDQEDKPSADQEDQEDKPSADQEDQEDKPSADQEDQENKSSADQEDQEDKPSADQEETI